MKGPTDLAQVVVAIVAQIEMSDFARELNGLEKSAALRTAADHYQNVTSAAAGMVLVADAFTGEDEQ